MDVKSKDIYFSDKRKAGRKECFSVIHCLGYKQNNEKRELEGPVELKLLNISVGGLGVLSETKFDKDSILILNIKLEEEQYEKVSARIIWEINKSGYYRYGLELCNMSGKLYRHINKLDNSIITEV